jgi:putative hydrolase of the HAD superfamily
VKARAQHQGLPSGVDGVLFDIDDTLVDTAGAFAHALDAVRERYYPLAGTARRDEVVAMWRADAGGHYRRYTQGGTGYRDQRMARANELHAAFGGPELDEAGFDDWDTVFEAGFSGAWSAHPEASQVVERLIAAGVAVGALSNASVEYQSSKLSKVGLGDRVPMLVGVDTLGVGKPDPRVFVEACRRLGTAPARTVYVGDELDVDARAALAAGLQAVWVDRTGPRRVPVPPEDITAARTAGAHVVTSLAEIPEILGLAVAP